MLDNYIVFIGSTFIITLAPGPDIIFSMTQGLTHGIKAGFTTALGLAAGNIVHTLLAVFGVAVIFKTNPIAFNILKYFGVTYLVYLGIQTIRHREDPFKLVKIDNGKKNLFVRGFIMNVLNPKVTIFFVAFFPQFVDEKYGNVSTQMFYLGIIFMVLVVLIFGSVSISAAMAGEVLKRKPNVAKYINISSTIIFFALAFKLILLQRL